MSAILGKVKDRTDEIPFGVVHCQEFQLYRHQEDLVADVLEEIGTFKNLTYSKTTHSLGGEHSDFKDISKAIYEARKYASDNIHNTKKKDNELVEFDYIRITDHKKYLETFLAYILYNNSKFEQTYWTFPEITQKEKTVYVGNDLKLQFLNESHAKNAEKIGKKMYVKLIDKFEKENLN